MPISQNRFGLNRKAMPEQSLESFLNVCHALEIQHIELRNDLKPDTSVNGVIDHLTVTDFNKLKSSIAISTINAIQLFNNPNEVAENSKQLEKLCELSAQIGNEAIIFCPEVNATDTRSEQEQIRDTANALKQYAPILKQYGLTGLVEPLGFEASTLRYPWQAIAAIKQAGVEETYQLTIDTFHLHLAHITFAQFKEKVPVAFIGLVHLSGVEPIAEERELTDADRILITPADIMKNVEQIQLIEELGYKGVYSFEPFADIFGTYSDEQIATLVKETIALINA